MRARIEPLNRMHKGRVTAPSRVRARRAHRHAKLADGHAKLVKFALATTNAPTMRMATYFSTRRGRTAVALLLVALIPFFSSANTLMSVSRSRLNQRRDALVSAGLSSPPRLLPKPIHIDCAKVLTGAHRSGLKYYNVLNHLTGDVLKLYGHDEIPDGVTTAFMEGRFYSADESSQIFSKLKRISSSGSKGSLVDIGANLGTVTIPIASAGFDVVSFEPAQPNLEKLKLNICANNLEHKISVIPLALGIRATRCAIYTVSHNKGNTVSFCDKKVETSEVAKHPELSGGTPVFEGWVNSTTLDEVIELLPYHSVVKMDCEGCEGGAVLGGLDYLRSAKRPESWLIEVNPPALRSNTLTPISESALLQLFMHVGAYKKIYEDEELDENVIMDIMDLQLGDRTCNIVIT